MLSHIHRGDIYEANFCMEFYAEEAVIAPYEVYKKLNEISDAPFSVYFKKNQHYLLSASPERYLKKENEKSDFSANKRYCETQFKFRIR